MARRILRDEGWKQRRWAPSDRCDGAGGRHRGRVRRQGAHASRADVPFDLPNATREEKFADCDNDVFAFYGVAGETVEARNAQGAGQIDELWILDVDGSIVILDAAYSPATPAEIVEEVRAIAETGTFEVP